MTTPDASIARDPRDNTPKVLPIVRRMHAAPPAPVGPIPPLHPLLHAARPLPPLPLTGEPRICCYCSSELSTDTPFCYLAEEPVPADKLCTDCFTQAMQELEMRYHPVLGTWVQLRLAHVARVKGQRIVRGTVLLPFRPRRKQV